MMKVIKFPKPKEVVSPDLLQEYWLHIRCTGPDLFAIMKFENHDEGECIQNGWMPQGDKPVTNEELRRYSEQLDRLKSFLADNSNAAIRSIVGKPIFYEALDDNNKNYCLYCKCKDGIVGVGWRFRDGNLTKAKMMAVFTLYAYGLSHAKTDATLWEVAYRHLPFTMQPSFDRAYADKVYLRYAAQVQ